MQGEAVNYVSYNMEQISKNENYNTYRVSIEIPTELGWIDCVNINVSSPSQMNTVRLDYQKKENGKAIFSKEIKLGTCALYKYYFSFFASGNYYTLSKDNKLGTGSVGPNQCFKKSVNFEAPEWAKGAVMYHVFLDRFCRGSEEAMKPMPRRLIHQKWDDDMVVGAIKTASGEEVWNADFYGGDLKGITKKLDYLDSLGVTIIYISPIVWSQSNHRYDAADYENVDPYAGYNVDLTELCNAAHQKGMKVVLDGVFNHTGNDSKYFNELHTFDTKGAFDNYDSPYRNFYRCNYNNGKKYFDYWWGFGNLPECNGFSSDWKNYITGEGGVIDKWFKLGIDGLRLDVADELSDEFISLIRRAVKRNKPDGLVIGEVWKNPMRMNRGYVGDGKGLDTVMNYPLMDALLRYFNYDDKNKLSYIIQDILNEYPEDTIHTLMNSTSTHDMTRAINLFAPCGFNPNGEWYWDLYNNNNVDCKNFNLTQEQYDQAKKAYQAYVYSLTFMPGILSIFYGDEAGVQGLGNLANRKPYPWGNQDEQLVGFFKDMGKIRKNEQFLKSADLNIYDINDKFFMFERIKNGDKALITVNRTNDKIQYNVPDEYTIANVINECKGGRVYTLNNSRPGSLTPYGGVAIRKNV